MQRGRRGVGLGPLVFGWELRPELRLKTNPEVGNPEIHRAARTKLHSEKYDRYKSIRCAAVLLPRKEATPVTIRIQLL